MIKLTLKTAGLLLIIAFSSSSMAQSPWAVEKTVVEEPEKAPQATPDTDIDTTEADNSSDNIESIDQQNTSPAAMGADSAVTTVDDEVSHHSPAAAPPSTTTATEHRGDVLNQTNQNLSSSVHLMDFPKRGMSTSKVQNELGQPTEILPAIGQPPITRWIYNDRTVYFEYSAVIHVVSN